SIRRSCCGWKSATTCYERSILESRSHSTYPGHVLARHFNDIPAGELDQIHILKVQAAIVIYAATGKIIEHRKRDRRRTANLDRKRCRRYDPRRRRSPAYYVSHCKRQHPAPDRRSVPHQPEPAFRVQKCHVHYLAGQTVVGNEWRTKRPGESPKVRDRIYTDPRHYYLIVAGQRAERTKRRRQVDREHVDRRHLRCQVRRSPYIQVPKRVPVVEDVLVESVRQCMF